MMNSFSAFDFMNTLPKLIIFSLMVICFSYSGVSYRSISSAYLRFFGARLIVLLK